MINKIIHYCWFGNTEPGAKIERCMESWARYLPDYRVVKWSESNSPMNVPYVQAMARQKLWAKVSNYVRLHALYEQGGIYFDTDIEVLKSFDSFLNDEGFIGFQQRRKNSDWVNNAVIGAVAGHAFCKKSMERVVTTYARERIVLRGPQIETQELVAAGLSQVRQASD